MPRRQAVSGAPITVLHIHNSRAIGGIELSLIGWLRHLDRERFRPELFCFEESDGAQKPFLEYLQQDGIPVHVLPWGLRKRAFSAVKILIGAIRASYPCVIHTHDLRPDAVGLLAAVATGCPIVASNHGWHSMWSGLAPKRRRNEWLRARILRQFDLVIAVGDSVRDESIRRGLARESVTTIHTGIDLESFQPRSSRACVRKNLGFSEDQVVIGNIARLHPEKGQSILLRAFSQVAGRVPLAQLLIVGEGPLLAALKAETENLALTNKVTFVAFEKDIAAMYSALDIFALPSLAEGTPLVVYKAAASGVPTVASQVAGVGELLSDGETALLVPPGDVDALAAALIRLACDDTGLACRLGRRAREVARSDPRFSVSNSTRSLELIYQGLVQSKRSGS